MIFMVSCLEREELRVVDTDIISFIPVLQSDNIPKTKSFSSNLSMTTEDWNLYDTKGQIVTKFEGDAKVLAYQYSGDYEEQKSQLPVWTTLSNAIFSFDGDELIPSSPVRWGQIDPANNHLRLFVYTPVTNVVGAEFPSVTVMNDAQPPVQVPVVGVPKIIYTLPTDLSEQVDILTAVKEVQTDLRKSIPLTFTHAFTALKFKMAFACKVNSIRIGGVYNKGVYELGKGWDADKYSITSTDNVYELNFGEQGLQVSADQDILESAEVMMMIPQTLPDGATISVTYDNTKTISTSLAGRKWDEGKLITYTLHEESSLDYIYVDLAAGNFTVTNNRYLGFIYRNNGADTVAVKGNHKSDNKYYVYQSTSANKSKTGWSGQPEASGSEFTLPSYKLAYVEQDGKHILWSDYITNNAGVARVINAWDNKAGTAGAVRNVGRTHTSYYIDVSGAVGICELYIDNIYSRYMEASTGRTTGGIAFRPGSGDNKLVINTIGDNRVGCIHYNNTSNNATQLILQGSGSITVADSDYNTASADTDTYSGKETTDKLDTCYYSNHWNAAIGNNDSNNDAYGIVINSGVIYAGTTKAENCTAIGGGGNGTSTVTINGGVITAVATTTGTAIGGGIGFTNYGGKGYVTIKGGNVYAYNHANRWKIPSSAIGGAGSSNNYGSLGKVIIDGGNIYAQSAGGTAIGGGSSQYKNGGDAEVIINDGIVVAKTLSSSSAGIGGGTTRTAGGSVDADVSANGGKAIITIGESGKPIVRTGSIGGGGTSADGGKIGSAEITIYEGDIQAQFVMAASTSNIFNMSGGTIRNSYHTDEEYKHIKSNGGAVYMEQGTFSMSGGIIQNCSGISGGAVYIQGTPQTTFTMSNDAKIISCSAESSGGAVYLENGQVILNGGTIYDNLAEQGNGGGVCVVGGNFLMPEESTAVIEANAAYSKSEPGYGSGGGIYVTSKSGNVTVDLLSGKIQNNTSDRTGGGIAVNVADGTNVAANVTVGIADAKTNQNPLISGNRASLLGGGMYVKGTHANIVINDGKILNNLTAAYVDNPDVANEGGTVKLVGGSVESVTVTYLPNAGTAQVKDENNQDVAMRLLTQKIVTSTNSYMDIPGTITRTGWKIVAWHTRSDGDDSKGKRYLPGDILNLSDDITLNAIWEENTTGSGANNQ